MAASQVEKVRLDVTEALNCIEMFFNWEIEEMQRQLNNLKRINVEIFSEHIKVQQDLGFPKEKNDIMKDIRNIIRD